MCAFHKRSELWAVVRVRCRHKKVQRLLSHLLMSFLLYHIISIVKKFYMRLYSKIIYHITLIVCAPYFVNLNNNTLR